MTEKHRAGLAGLAAVAILGIGSSSASAASGACPEARVACTKPVKPAKGSQEGSSVRPKTAPQLTKDAYGRDAWQSGSWLMQ